MYQRLTKSLIDSLVAPSTGQTIIRDSEIRGFALRITPNCKSFVVEGIVNGSRKRITLGRCGSVNVEDARREAQRMLAEMASGVQPVAAAKTPTLGEALSRFLTERPLKATTRRSYRRHFERLLPDWLDLPINAITKEMVAERHNKLVRPTRCGTDNKACANTVMQLLRTLFTFASDVYRPVENPTDTLRWRWYRLEARTGTIPDHRLADFYRTVMGHKSKLCRDLLLLLLFSGLRRGETSRLRWTDIQERTLTIPASSAKNEKEHVLPLTPMMLAILESRRGGESEYVFPGRYQGHVNEPRKSLEVLREQMGWQFLLHDLRRTALSNAEKAGAPYAAIARIANHSMERGISDRYVIMDAEFIRPHMEAMNNRILQLMGTSVEQWRKDDVGAPAITSVTVLPVVLAMEREEEEVYW